MLSPSLKSVIPVANGNHESSCDHQVDVADWVVMSRVRCMCRLLVDCSSFTSAVAITNTSSTSSSTTNATANTNNTTTKGRGLKKGNSTSVVVAAVSKSSTDALVQCWKGIVKKQLQEVLGSLLTDDRPHSMATGLVNIYTKLKCAMRELFGGHSRYAIALKEGFAEQLQTLSESHSVQVKKLHSFNIIIILVFYSFVSHSVPQLTHCSMSLDRTITSCLLPWKQKGKPF